MATNSDWAVPAGDQERRFLVQKISKKHQQDHDYFGAIDKQMMDGGREALMHYLMNLDISDINLRDVPKTEALWDQQFNSMPIINQFWLTKLKDGEGYDDNLPMSRHWRGWESNSVSVPTQEVYDEFLVFSKHARGVWGQNPAQFGKDFKAVCPIVEKKRSSSKNKVVIIHT